MKTRALPIGIDLGTAAVKMAQLRRADGELELTAAALTEAPAEFRDDFDERLGLLAGQLHRLLKEHCFTGRQCVLALPSDATFIQHVKIAKQPPGKLEQALRKELEGTAPFDPADAIIRHVVVKGARQDGEARQEVIVIAAARQTVETYLQLARRSKLEVVVLNVRPCAIVECFARAFRRVQDDDRTTLFLDLGRANTQVVIAHGAQLAFARNVMLGSRDVDEVVAARLGSSAEEAGATRRDLAERGEQSERADRLYAAAREAVQPLVDEIIKCLHYHQSAFPSRPVQRALFLGGQARDRRLCQQIARRINLPAQIGDPLARIGRADGVGLDIGMDRRQAQPAWAVAVGLSIGAEMPNAA